MTEMEWLDSLGAMGMKLGLDNITELLSLIGDPQNDVRMIHVAGSDGKGSTSAMIHSVLKTAGRKTGLYTSPHVNAVNERISVDSMISDDEMESLIKEIRPKAEWMCQHGRPCTYFEVLTAMAFLHFKNVGAEYAVIETGLGGRFDATNVITPEVSVITHISLEHTAILGDTIEKIAFEKAGIIKEGRTVVTANVGDALKVISKISLERDSKLIKVDTSKISDIQITENGTSMMYSGRPYGSKIPGRYQAENMAVVVETINALNTGMSDEMIRNGLHEAAWGYRMERKGNVILDVTHTATGSEGLAKDVLEIYGKVVLVFGLLDDKDLTAISANLSTVASKVIVTRPDSDRAIDPRNVMMEMKKHHDDVSLAGNVNEAMELASKACEKTEMILVTGSFYMVGDAEKWLKKTYVGS